MPDVPSADDVKDTGRSAYKDGAVYGAGTAVGSLALGPLGAAAGGTIAGASIGGQKGETLATVAIGMAANDMAKNLGGN